MRKSYPSQEQRLTGEATGTLPVEQRIITELNHMRRNPAHLVCDPNRFATNFSGGCSKHPSLELLKRGMLENDFDVVRCSAGKNADNLILSKFKAPYNPDLGLDGLWFKKIDVSPQIRSSFPSNAQPIIIIDCTDGFKGPRSVALFPENFDSRIPPGEHAPVLYFMDKFIQRFERITLDFLSKGLINSEPFCNIIDLSTSQKMELASGWVVMHEHFHAKGALPLQQSLSAKSSRSSAALEELRVDILSILAAHSQVVSWNRSLGERLAQFILAERLLRYPIEAHPRDDYDARSSVLLACLLRRFGVLDWTREKLRIDQGSLIRGLKEISIEIDKLECSIKHLPADKQKTSLVEFVRHHGLTDQNGKFLNLEVFERVACDVA